MEQLYIHNPMADTSPPFPDSPLSPFAFTKPSTVSFSFNLAFPPGDL